MIHHPKSVCIFDFDGTLVDSMGDFADLAAGLIEETYAMARDEAKAGYMKTSGLPFFQQLAVLFPEDARNSQVAEAFEERKLQNYLEKPFFAEVPHALKTLRQQGVQVAISSNNGQSVVERFLAGKNGTGPEFDLVLGYREGFAKGSDHFKEVLSHFAVRPEQVLFVGDSLHDARKAKAFGLDFLGRLGTFGKADFSREYPEFGVVENLTELVEILCKSSS